MAGTLICLLWSFSNAAFSFWLAKEPIKNGQPLTTESKDPNGSLLNGLKSKKPRISVITVLIPVSWSSADNPSPLLYGS
jgi:nucleoporin NDC1